MSVAVGLDQLRDETGRFGRFAYLLTVGDDGRPHAVSVAPSWDGDALTVRVGRTSEANARARTDVTLLWPPVDETGYSLIVDGTASSAGGGDDGIAVAPTKAVLHRSAGTDGDGRTRSDCVPIYRPSP